MLYRGLGIDQRVVAARFCQAQLLNVARQRRLRNVDIARFQPAHQVVLAGDFPGADELQDGIVAESFHERKIIHKTY